MNRTETAALIKRVKSVYPLFQREATIEQLNTMADVWASALADTEPTAAQSALAEYAASHRYPPQISDLVALAGKYDLDGLFMAALRKNNGLTRDQQTARITGGGK